MDCKKKSQQPFKPDAEKIRALMTGVGATVEQMLKSGKARESNPATAGSKKYPK